MGSHKNNVADIFWRSPGQEIQVLALRYHEGLSSLYLLQCDICCEEGELDTEAFLNVEAEVVVKCGEDLGEERIFSGIITRIAQKRTRYGNLPNASGQNYLYEVDIRPKFYLATLQRRSRVFWKMGLQEVVAKTLDDLGIAYKWQLKDSPKDREYIVQYEETDYAFICRLLEAQGICFFFDHQDRKVIFSNNTPAHDPCQPLSELMYAEEVSPRMQLGQQAFLRDFDFETQCGPGRFPVNHYNHETSQTSLLTEKKEKEVPCFPALEHYHHSLNYKDKGEGDYFAEILRKGAVAQHQKGRGSASSRSIQAGYLLTIKDHFRGSYNTDWLITACDVTAEQGNYNVHFTALPAEIPFVPAPKTPKPKVHGIQTATVTGPEGDEVYLDELGRCKIQFHWDREGPKSDASSMWTRVAQQYAGKGYGFQWIPRVGDEVLVTFINGDPSLPVVTGRVYNDAYKPPLGPPEKYQNIIKTIKDHHILFDDKDGSERMAIRSQRNMDTLVMNDQTLKVHNNRTDQVDVNDSLTVGEDQAVTIGGSQTESVGAERTTTVGSDVSLQVGASRQTTITADETLTIGGNQNNSVGGNVNKTIGGGQTLSVGANQALTVGASQSVSAGASITVNAGGQIAINAGAGITLTCAGSTVSITPAGITLAMGANSISINPAMVMVNGTLIKLN